MLIAFCIFGAAWKPPFINEEEFPDLPEEVKSNIVSTSKGFYNETLPIFALYIRLLNADGERVVYRVNYFPFGYTETEYLTEEDGTYSFNQIKSLSSIS